LFLIEHPNKHTVLEYSFNIRHAPTSSLPLSTSRKKKEILRIYQIILKKKISGFTKGGRKFLKGSSGIFKHRPYFWDRLHSRDSTDGLSGYRKWIILQIIKTKPRGMRTTGKEENADLKYKK